MNTSPVRVAVASHDGQTVSGHIGKCADWLVFSADIGEDGEVIMTGSEHITLPKHLIFHHYKDDTPHPLAGCMAVIGASAGDSFVSKMEQRGIKVALTAECDPATAVAHYLKSTLSPPKQRPIGSLICKIHDALS